MLGNLAKGDIHDGIAGSLLPTRQTTTHTPTTHTCMPGPFPDLAAHKTSSPSITVFVLHSHAFTPSTWSSLTNNKPGVHTFQQTHVFNCNTIFQLCTATSSDFLNWNSNFFLNICARGWGGGCLGFVCGLCRARHG